MLNGLICDIICNIIDKNTIFKMAQLTLGGNDVNTTCCFIGHRDVEETAELKEKLYNIIEDLIANKNVSTFLFGSKSKFDDLCYDIVDDLKEKYSYIKRIYVRAEYPYINEDYRKRLLKYYEDSYFPEKVLNSGRSVYVQRNNIMVDKSKYCIFYYDENNTKRVSGTLLAFNYAKTKKKSIINVK